MNIRIDVEERAQRSIRMTQTMASTNVGHVINRVHCAVSVNCWNVTIDLAHAARADQPLDAERTKPLSNKRCRRAKDAQRCFQE